jgi:hypothetical protein
MPPTRGRRGVGRQGARGSGNVGQVAVPIPAGSLGVAAFGDSLMWGQGNNRADRFSMIFTKQLQGRVGKPGVLAWDASRSGSKIRDEPDERESFPDIYPHLFPNARVRRAFLDGKDDSPASGLYGEVPATFPTVLGQVNMIPPTLARQIDVALVDGGINDVSPEEIINPLIATGSYIERYDGEIRRVVENDVTALLQAVRAKCPKAVIMYFGFFPGMSYSSDANKLSELFKHEYNDDFKWWLNRYIYEVIDTDKMINEAMTRALWFNGRWQYWTRRAVNAMNANDAKRGPGVLFVPSGFNDSNAAFAFAGRLWDDYTFPTQDPAVEARLRGIPRQAQLEQMKKALRAMSRGNTAEALKLDAVIDGPLTLKRNLQDFVAGQADAQALALETLADEIHRIQHGMIASLAHPNKQGALSYATQAGSRYAQHLKTMAKVRTENLAGPPVGDPANAPAAPTLDETLKKYNLRGRGALAGDVTHLQVDSLAVIVKTAPNSSRNMGLPAYLVLTVSFRPTGDTVTKQFLLTFMNYVRARGRVTDEGDPIGKPYPYLEPGQVNRLTVVVDDDLNLSDIVSTAILLGPDPYPADKGSRPDPRRSAIRSRYGRRWSPDSVTLEVNGRPVHTAELFGQKIGPDGHVDLGWPDPDPAFQPPVVVMPKVRRVRQLGAFATTPNIPAPIAPPH